MRLGYVVKDPDVDRAVSINIATYRGSAVVSGTPAWSVSTGLEIEDESVDGDALVAVVSGGQEGCNYLATCRVEFVGGASEDFTVEVRVRTGDHDPRLTR